MNTLPPRRLLAGLVAAVCLAVAVHAQAPTTAKPAAAPTSVKASTLIGNTTAQITTRLGVPSSGQSSGETTTWYYDAANTTLRLTFTAGKVTSAVPPDFDLSSIKPKSPTNPATTVPAVPSPRPTPASGKSSVPAGASAQRRDGTYSFSHTRSGTCSHHGGVATWL